MFVNGNLPHIEQNMLYDKTHTKNDNSNLLDPLNQINLFSIISHKNLNVSNAF